VKHNETKKNALGEKGMGFMQVGSVPKHNETFFGSVSLCFAVLPKVESEIKNSPNS